MMIFLFIVRKRSEEDIIATKEKINYNAIYYTIGLFISPLLMKTVKYETSIESCI